MNARFVVITPAHNERAFITHTIESMVAQTVRPDRWIVVDDGSTDGTGDLVAAHAERHSFIALVRKPREPERNFARKVAAFNAGLAALGDTPYDFIGNIDADMSFRADYFERILQAFEHDADLGLSGGIVYTKFAGEFKTYDHTPDSVGGKVQLFRRRCFEDIGGYRALKFGGIDATAEIMARQHGWRVGKVFKAPAYEHRPTGFAYGNPVQAKWCEGRRFQSLGYDPLFYTLRCLRRAAETPLLVGSAAAWLRFMLGALRRDPVLLPPEVVAFLRREQRAKLRERLGGGGHSVGHGRDGAASETGIEAMER